MKKTRQVLSIILAVLLIAVSVPFAFAEDGVEIGGQCGEKAYWKLDDQGKLTVFGEGEMSYYWDGGSGNNWYQYREQIKSAEIQSGITSIWDYAFEDCYYLESVSIADTVTTIGETAFGWCHNLDEFVLPQNLVSIGRSAFYDCDQLKTIVLPNTLQSIGERAFDSCNNLSAISIPASVSEIGFGAFRDCNLTSIDVDPANTAYLSDDGVLFNKDQTVLIQYPRACSSYDYTVPDTVEEIADYALSNAYQLETVEFPQGLVSIGNYAFCYCNNLDEIEFPQGLVSIGNYAFYDCYNLAEIKLPDSLQTIGSYAFSNCSILSEISIPASVETIGDRCFAYNRATAFIVDPENPAYASDDDGVLYNKAKTTLIQYPLYNPRTEYTVADTIETIAHNAFSNAAYLKQVTIPGNVQTIENNAFSSCSRLKKVSLMPGIQEIQSGAFNSCERLQTVSIPASVTAIGNEAFSYCRRITSFSVDAENTKYFSDDNGILYSKAGTLIQYPAGSKATELTVAAGTKTIERYAFYYAAALMKINLPESLKTIQYAAFRYCSGLGSIVIPDGIKTISSDAFEYCTNLTTIYLPFSVTGIYSDAFDGCHKLSKVYYAGTEDEWNDVEISNGNEPLTSADVQFCNHVTTSNVPAVEATCAAFGYTAGLQCDTCKRWLKGHKKVVAAHTDANADGICDVCGGLASEIEVGVEKTITIKNGTYTYVRFIPTKDGAYSWNAHAANNGFDGGFVDENQEWVNSNALEAGEVYYLSIWFNHGDYEDGEELEATVLLNRRLAGQCGNNMSWQVEKYYNGENDVNRLYIYGDGKMWNYSEEPAPWSDIENITEVRFDGDITAISPAAFATLNNVNRVYNYSYTLVASSAIQDYASDFTTYCFNRSAEHQYCKENNIPFSLFDGEREELVDEETGVAVSFDEEAFGDANVSLDVEVVETENTNALAWEITPVDEETGETVQPNQPVQIWLPIPSSWRNLPLLVTHTHQDGAVEIITEYSIQGDFIVFWVDSFSVFEVTAQEEAPHVHTFGEPVIENEHKATCKEGGSYEEVVYCTECGDEISRRTVTTQPTGQHTPGEPVIENENKANCQAGGSYEEVVYCTVCGDEISRRTVTTDPTGQHTPAEAVRENEIAATCEADGSYEEVVYCADCGEELSRKEVETDKLEHVDEDNDGHCDNCGEQMQDDDHCKFCGKIHNGGFFDKLTGFFHKIFAIFKR